MVFHHTLITKHAGTMVQSKSSEP